MTRPEARHPDKVSLPVAVAEQSLLLDLKRASVVLGTSIWTLRDLIHDGSIPAHRIGRKDFVRRVDLNAYVSHLTGGTDNVRQPPRGIDP